MIDQTLKELWQTKDDIAKEHDYNLDALVAYLRSKARAQAADTFQPGQTRNTEQDASVDARNKKEARLNLFR